MAKETDSLKKLIHLLRTSGVSRLKNADIEIELHPSSLFPESIYQQKKKAKAELKSDTASPNLVEQAEQTLFWSSAQMPGESAQ